MVVYKTTNIINGKIYVGQDSKNNPDYIGSGNLIKLAIKKYGKKNFTKEILERCFPQTLNSREIFWIDKLDSRNPKTGYNIAIGGDGCCGCKHSEEYKRKMSETTIGKNNSFYGKHHSDETILKIRLAKQGKRHSEEHKRKISESRKGLCHSDETKRKMSKSRRGLCHSEESKRKMRDAWTIRKRKEVY